MSYTQEQMDKLYRQERSIAARVDGIWRSVKGVYIAPAESGKAQIILNGKFVTIMPGHWIDLHGYTDLQIEYEIVRRNLASLPPAPIKKKFFTPTGLTNVVVTPPRRRRTIVTPE